MAALEQAKAEGARAVKWLPSAMGIDPASPLCDDFYRTLARLDLPLISHAGTENAVHGVGRSELGNPLKLRRPLVCSPMPGGEAFAREIPHIVAADIVARELQHKSPFDKA